MIGYWSTSESPMACPTYHTTTNATKDCDIERGSGNHDEIRSITGRRNLGRDEPYSSIVGQYDAPNVRYQEG